MKAPLHSDSCCQFFDVLSTATADDEVIVDFDETLLLRNSTAEYLSFIKPGLAAALVFRGLSVIRPWRWLTPKHPELSRDWFQVLVLTLLFPWNLLRWKKQARRIAQDYKNESLANGLNTTQANVTIATYGYRFVVDPILREMGVPYSKLVACRFWGAFRDRVKGKVELLGVHSLREKKGKLIAITDSEADAPLLECCDFSYLIQWPEAKSRAPFLEVYLPFLYLTKVKWPGKNYLSRNILGDDLPLYLLAFGLTAKAPFWTSLVILLLALSFWCVYERGYNENDELGELKEKDPKLSEAYFQGICRVSEGSAWIWSLALGCLGVWIHVGHQVKFSNAEIWADLWPSVIIWFSVLLGCRLVFSIYNHTQKSARPALYPILQIFRYVGLAALLPVSLVGGLALCSQVTARSLNYLAYRKSGGKNWPDVPEQIIRIGIFTLLFFAFIPSVKEELFSPITVVIFLWFLFRASKQIVRFVGLFVRPKKTEPAVEGFSSPEKQEAPQRDLI